MAKLISGSNISLAWLQAMEHLLSHGGKDVNLIVSVDPGGDEDPRVRQHLDAFLRDRRRQDVVGIATVANTLFPQSFYRPQLGQTAEQHLYDLYRSVFPKIRRHPANRAGTYFHRLIAWPGRQGEVNQLQRVVERLRRELATPGPKSSIYELGHRTDDDMTSPDLELQIYRPDTDTRIMGFPCLSHISLTLRDHQLYLTAVYRNQHFVRKAYGNYLGLSHLLQFLCQQSGCDAGELVCLATHADAELGVFGRRMLSRLVEQCQASRQESGIVLLSSRQIAESAPALTP